MEGVELTGITTPERKKEIRKHILKQRDAIPEGKRKRDSAAITKALVALPVYQEAEVIMAYCSYQSEMDTRCFIDKALLDGRQVYVPKVSGDSMDFYRITCTEELKPGYKGIPEPDGGDVLTANYLSGKKALMLMPGAAFDRKHNRIGYGKGYYDKYLSGLRQELSDCERMPYTVAICFSVQLVEQIPEEEHDIRPDRIVTELEIF